MHSTSDLTKTMPAAWTTWCLSVLFALLLPASVLADAVSGRVFAPDGKPEPNKTFNAKAAKGEAVVFKSDASGNFSLYLDPGRYTVTSSADSTVEGVIESYPQPVQQDIHLKKR